MYSTLVILVKGALGVCHQLFKQKWIMHYDVTFHCILVKRPLYTMVIQLFFIHTVISIQVYECASPIKGDLALSSV